MKNPSSYDQLEGEVRWPAAPARRGGAGRPRRVVTAADAVRFIDSVGYCLLFPIRGLPLPSLYYACARRECTAWDKYCLRIWKWKDELGRRRRAFYTKYFKGRGTFLALKLLPHFLAMERSTFGAEGFDRAYAEGRITIDARDAWKMLAAHGPLATLELRHACKMDSKAGNRRFKKAMLQLSRLLIVFHSGAEQETESWASSRFELTARTFPAAIARAREIEPAEARRVLAKKYLEWHPQADVRSMTRLFGWTNSEALPARGDGERS